MTQSGDRTAGNLPDDALCRRILEDTSQGLIIFDDAWRPLFVNAAYLKLFGYEHAEEILALPTVEPLISRVDRERMQSYRRARTSGQHVPQRYDFTGIRKDGSRIVLEAFITRVEYRGESAVCTTVTDVTLSRRVARDAAARQHRLTAQHEALLGFARFDGAPADLTERVTEAVCETVSVERTCVWHMDPSGRTATLADRFFRGAREHRQGNRLPTDDFPTWFDALAEGRAVAADSVADHPATLPFVDTYLAEQGITSVLAAPIRSGQELLGFICCEHIGPPRRWNEDEQGFLASTADILAQSVERTRRQQADARARASDSRYRHFFAAAPVALWEEDWSSVSEYVMQVGNGDRDAGVRAVLADRALLERAADRLTILDVNRAAVELTGTRDAGACKAHLRAAMTQMSDLGFADRLERFAAGERHLVGPAFMRRANGEVADLQLTVECAADEPEDCVRALLVAEDVTEKRAMARTLDWQREHDTRTGLLNAQAFERRIAAALSSLATSDSSAVVAFIDIDRFRMVNDISGHAAGDQLLGLIAAELARAVRRDDTLARIGGDAFGVLMEDCTVDDARSVAESLRQVIAGFRFAWGGNVHSLGASIGLVPLATDTDSSRVLADGETACDAAKEAGRNRVHVFQPASEAMAARRGQAAWVARLQNALDEDAFTLVGQPVVPLQATGNGTESPRVEVLLRLRSEHAEEGPAAFMPAAERFGLSSTLDRWVLNRTLGLMRAGTNTAMTVSVNLSGHSLGDDDFLEFARKRIVASGVAPDRLCFEITETVAISNLEAATRLIAELRALGCGFALDDFGRGVSSFAYLKTLPVDFLKIDGLFVRGVVDDELDRSMVRTINEVAHTAGIRTVAEFVEDAEVLDVLRTLGIDYAQGFAMGPSLALEDVLR